MDFHRDRVWRFTVLTPGFREALSQVSQSELNATALNWYPIPIGDVPLVFSLPSLQHA